MDAINGAWNAELKQKGERVNLADALDRAIKAPMRAAGVQLPLEQPAPAVRRAA
jgi:hypothetical protein